MVLVFESGICCILINLAGMGLINLRVELRLVHERRVLQGLEPVPLLDILVHRVLSIILISFGLGENEFE